MTVVKVSPQENYKQRRIFFLDTRVSSCSHIRFHSLGQIEWIRSRQKNPELRKHEHPDIFGGTGTVHIVRDNSWSEPDYYNLCDLAEMIFQTQGISEILFNQYEILADWQHEHFDIDTLAKQVENAINNYFELQRITKEEDTNDSL